MLLEVSFGEVNVVSGGFGDIGCLSPWEVLCNWLLFTRHCFTRWVDLPTPSVMPPSALLQTASFHKISWRVIDEKSQGFSCWTNELIDWYYWGNCATLHSCVKTSKDAYLSISFGCNLNRFPWFVSHDFCPRPTQPITDVCINWIRLRFDLIPLKGKKWKRSLPNGGGYEGKCRVNAACTAVHWNALECSAVH